MTLENTIADSFAWKTIVCTKKNVSLKERDQSFEKMVEDVKTKMKAQSLQLYWKRDSGTGVLLWILRNVKNRFLQNTSGRLLWELGWVKWLRKRLQQGFNFHVSFKWSYTVSFLLKLKNQKCKEWKHGGIFQNVLPLPAYMGHFFSFPVKL